MASFDYHVRDGTGAAISGMLDAQTLEDARKILRSDGKIIVRLDPHTVIPAAYQGRPKRVQPDDLLYFSTQLAVMVDTGVQLTEALDSIAEQTDHSGLKAMVSDIASQVKNGTEFSVALDKYKKVFGELYVNMVAASEASGTMGSMLQRLCDYIRSQREIRKQIRGAMLYPVGILSFSVTIVVLMMIFILPRFEKIYAGKDAVLPLPTRVLLASGNALTEHWHFFLLGLGVTVVALVQFLRTPAGQLRLDSFRLRLPVIGSLYHKVYVSRSLRTLGTMLTSGVEMLQSLRITAAVAGNGLYQRMWLRAEENLQQGETLSEQLFQSALIPRGIAQMIASGEKSGRLPDVMERIADFCESDVRVGVKSLTALMEPAMIAIMGLLVGGIALALLLPVFSISKVVSH